MSLLFEQVYNPDILNCLANLSNDEVFTPPEVVNNMLDMLPQELFKSPDTTFLDPACKTGVFLREIAKRLLVGLQEVIPDENERRRHIFTKQLYGIAITELTSLLSRRSLYCSKYANTIYSIAPFDRVEGNIRFKNTEHFWDGNKCGFCGASKSQYDRDKELEQYAYEFIHTSKPEEIWNMRFDVIIGNPPYQLDDGGAQASAKPIYHHFVMQAKKLMPRYLSMIIPARWYAGGKGLDSFRSSMLSDRRIRNLVDYADSSELFSGVTIAGGICYFLWDRDAEGFCKITNVSKETRNTVSRALDEYPVLVRNNLAVSIIRKILARREDTMISYVKNRNSFGITTTFKSDAKNKKVNCLSSKGDILIGDSEIVDRDGIKDKYKVITTYAMSGGHKPSAKGDYTVLSSLLVVKPGVVFSETYLCLGAFDVGNEAINMQTYAQTRFFRFLLLQALTSIHITKDKFLFVPVQDFSKPWNDTELYAKYCLTNEEIAFIESTIRPME